MNYKSEREHDKLLISLVEQLNQCNSNHWPLLQETFQIEDNLGKLKAANHRRSFDVELTFENLSIVIETKVDSDESGRWDSEWQTSQIKRKSESLDYLHEEKVYCFITYGTSEFYTKPFEAGAACSSFKHIKLDSMIKFVDRAIKVLPQPCSEFDEWLRKMCVERDMRSSARKLLKLYSKFKRRYQDINGENDFARNRTLFCSPELAFPVMYSLLNEWSFRGYSNKFGKLSLYPVGNMVPPINDSILNFWEIWGKKEFEPFYFEINEDFNLNVKTEENLDENTRNEVWDSLDQAFDQASLDCHCCRRNYRQSAYVWYEIDFRFLAEVKNISNVAEILNETMKVVVDALFPIQGQLN